MVTSKAATAEEFLASFPEERRAVLTAVRELILGNLPPGYVETMNWGMLCYEVPLDRYPDTYNGQPLSYVALTGRQDCYALYMTGPYVDEPQAAALREAFAKEGKKLDMGKSCVRFRKLDDLALDAVASTIAGTPPERFIELHEAGRAQAKTKRKTAAKKK